MRLHLLSRRLFSVTIGILALGLAFTNVAAQTRGAEDQRLVRISYSTGWDALPIVVALERGFFAGQGLVVSGVAAGSASAVAQSLHAGSTDVAIMPQRAFLAMVDAGVEVRAIMVNTWGAQMQLVVPPDSPIKQVTDLAGRRVGLSRGSSALPILIRLLNQAGLSPDELTIAEMPAAQLAKALPEGQTDAVFDVAHVTAPLVSGGLGRPAMDPDTVRKTLGLIDAMPVVASARFLEREPETVQRVVTAWVEAQRYIHREPEDSARLLRIFLHRHGLTASQALVDAWIGLQRYDRPLWTRHAITDAEYNGWGLKEVGMLDKVPSLAKFVDNRFLELVTDGWDARPHSSLSNRQ